MKLVYIESRLEVKEGDIISREGREDVVITTIQKPHKPSSTGKVYFRRYGKPANEEGVYPSVIGAEWVDREDQIGSGDPVPIVAHTSISGYRITHADTPFLSQDFDLIITKDEDATEIVNVNLKIENNLLHVTLESLLTQEKLGSVSFLLPS